MQSAATAPHAYLSVSNVRTSTGSDRGAVNVWNVSNPRLGSHCEVIFAS